MDNSLSAYQATLAQFRLRAEQLIGADDRRGRLASPADVAHRELFAGIGGILSSEFLGSRRIGSSFGRAIAVNTQDSQRRARLSTTRVAAGDLVAEVRKFVETISQTLGQQMTHSLLRLLAQADSAQRSETAARRVIEAVRRIEAWRLPGSARIATETPGECLRALETALRRCIETQLARVEPNWWTTRVPMEVRSRAERRMALRERVWPWLRDGDHSAIEYLDFPDYGRTILDNRNWDQVFSPIFVDAEALSVKLRELEPIRNDIAHSREITISNDERLRLYARELVERAKRG